MFIAAVLAAGCGNPPDASTVRPAPDSSTERLLGKLLDAHGGRATWEGYEAVRFAYRAHIGRDATVALAEIGFRTRDYRYMWFRAGQGPERIRLSLDSRPGTIVSVLEERGLAVEPSGGDLEWDRGELDLTLRRMRYLFQLPLVTTAGRWEFRSLVSPPGYRAPLLLEVCPLAETAPIGPCLVAPPHGVERIDRVLYVARSPGGPAGASEELRQLILGEYREVGGIWVATRRSHVPAPAEEPGEEKPDPFGLAPEAALLERSSIVREEVTEITFLGPAEARAAYPLPEDAETPPTGKQP